LPAAGKRITLLAEGLAAGMFGGVAVILVFLAYDALQGDPFRTPSVLHALVLEGPEAARGAEGELGRAVGYVGLHLLVWLTAGLVSACLIHLVERRPTIWLLVLASVAAAFASVLWVEQALGVPGLGRFHLLAGALIGSGVMLTWLWWRHPEVLEPPDEAHES
jgi:hypothetical protein